jgi:RNA polymerase sigma-70 factor (ECF subfamily)
MHEPIRRVPGNETGDGGDDAHQFFAAEFQASFRAFWLTAAGIVGDPALAEDIVQEAALIALGKIDQFRPGSSVTAWVGAIVRNVALNHLRKERTRAARRIEPDEWDQLEPKQRSWNGEVREVQPPAPAAPFVSDRRLLDALSEVGETARACLLLRTLDSMEYAKISELLDIPEGTAMSHVHRARKWLRERLDTSEFGDQTRKVRDDL